MKTALMTSFLLVTLMAPAAFAAGIGYDMLEEKQDGPTHTYTMVFDVWSEDRKAEEISVTPKTASTNIKIQTPKKVWKNLAKGKHVKHAVVITNSSEETGSVDLLIERKAGNRKDSKTVQVQVAPQ